MKSLLWLPFIAALMLFEWMYLEVEHTRKRYAEFEWVYNYNAEISRENRALKKEIRHAYTEERNLVRRCK